MHCAMSKKSKVRVFVSCLLVLALSSAGVRADEGTAKSATSERDVVKMALEHYPGLRVSLQNLESARWGVLGEEGRYVPTLVLDGTFTRTEQQQPYKGTIGMVPGSMIPGATVSGVSETKTRRAEAGAELR